MEVLGQTPFIIVTFDANTDINANLTLNITYTDPVNGPNQVTTTSGGLNAYGNLVNTVGNINSFMITCWRVTNLNRS